MKYFSLLEAVVLVKTANTPLLESIRVFLGVPPTQVLEKYKEVIASTYSERALEYRRNKDIMESEVAMAVGCQMMIRAKVSGVVYTLDPFDLKDEKIVIASTYGLGEELVGGTIEADKYYISRTPPHDIIEMNIVSKPFMKNFDFKKKIHNKTRSFKREKKTNPL